MKKLVTVLLVAVVVIAQARIAKYWTYQELFDQADLVVVAKVTSSNDTAEQTVLPSLTPDVHVVGLNTKIAIRVVMKGDTSLTNAVLHHYRFAKPDQMLFNAPNLVTFNPKDKIRFLMFLHRDPDGRYSPVSGQVDPAEESIVKLDGGPHDLGDFDSPPTPRATSAP